MKPRKRLVICCDGTWNSPDAENVTNIEKIARTVETDPARTDGVQQLVYYLSGVGAGSYKADRILGGAFGFGLFAHVRSAYRFLALNYEPGDEIFVFGFSRGAYTARSLVGMVSLIGLLTRRALVEDQLGSAVALYHRGRGERHEHDAELTAFRAARCHDGVEISLLGVFDTVGALGVPGAPGALKGTHQFHDVRLSPIVRTARHALALDERRLMFEPSLWKATEADAVAAEASGRVRQVWFPGVHSDVGGGYQRSGLSDTTLLWIARESRAAGLVFDADLLNHYVASNREAVEHDSLSRQYEGLNLLSRTRMRLRGGGDAFDDGWRRLDPAPDRDGHRAVGVSIASTAAAWFRDEARRPPYRNRNVAAFAGSTRTFTDRETTVIALPLTAGPLAEALAAAGADLTLPAPPEAAT